METHMTMTIRFISFAAVFSLCTLPGLAQTYTALLEKGIFLEETAGDLDGAVTIYRQIASAQTVPRDVGMQAETRLAEILVRKGQPVQAATAQAAQPGQGCCGMFSSNYDPTREVEVTGTIRAVMWVNPMAIVLVDGTDGNRWGFTLGAPNAMIRGGLNKSTLTPGEQVRVRGYLAAGVGENCPTALPNACATLAPNEGPGATVPIGGAVHASARSINTMDGRNLFDRPAMEKAGAQQ
jgi:hypothetical protein